MNWLKTKLYIEGSYIGTIEECSAWIWLGTTFYDIAPPEPELSPKFGLSVKLRYPKQGNIIPSVLFMGMDARYVDSAIRRGQSPPHMGPRPVTIRWEHEDGSQRDFEDCKCTLIKVLPNLKDFDKILFELEFDVPIVEDADGCQDTVYTQDVDRAPSAGRLVYEL